MDIVVDFDGTVVTHEFPKVGKDIGAVPVLKKLIENGHQLILFTMRSNIVNPISENDEIHLESGNYLTDAIEWFKENEIPLYGIQTNPTQHTWTTSPKAYADLYIDDAALGCPLKYDKEYAERPFVDWIVVEKILEKQLNMIALKKEKEIRATKQRTEKEIVDARHQLKSRYRFVDLTSLKRYNGFVTAVFIVSNFKLQTL